MAAAGSGKAVIARHRAEAQVLAWPVEALAEWREREAEDAMLPLDPAGADPELDPAARDHVERGELLGDLDRVVRCVKLVGFVNCTEDFGEQPKVINGASDLMVQVFGEAGRHARSAVGMGSLPNQISVEIEGIFSIKP